jgi:chlorite dismutase
VSAAGAARAPRIGEDAPGSSPDDVDVREQGRGADGERITADRRLFMQLLAFGGAPDSQVLVQALEQAGLAAVLYEDVNDPTGVALLVFGESPEIIVTDVRRFLRQAPFAGLVPKPEYTMLGRTYAIGHEADLAEALIDRPQARVCDPALRWAIWYPLRRAGSFERLPREEQSVILMEHAGIGRAFGRAGLGYDVRLACHGLDKNDNDFVIGLLGGELHPLSVIVQRMRKTKQTSLHLDRLGPFFVGRAVWQLQR